MTVVWAESGGTVLFWRDLAVRGSTEGSEELWLESLEGWEEIPDTSQDLANRPAAHGAFDAPVWAGPRRVVVTGWAVSERDRDGLLARLRASLALPSGRGELETLAIGFAGRTLTAQARLRRFKPTVQHWASGAFGWAAEWVAPDPLRYLPARPVSTGLPAQAGGLRVPLFTDGDVGVLGHLDFGAPGTAGRLLLSNEGTAELYPSFEVAGPLPLGFALQEVRTGRRLEFASDVPAGMWLEVDQATSRVRLRSPGDSGGVSRSGLMVRREWTPIPPGGTSEWVFTSAGPYHPDACATGHSGGAFW
ncbi:MAG: hypothetical protein ACYC1Z_03370 [Georgenia sp.]